MTTKDVPFATPTSAEMDLIVQGYRDRLNEREPERDEAAYQHGYRVGGMDMKGDSAGWQHELLDAVRAKAKADNPFV